VRTAAHYTACDASRQYLTRLSVWHKQKLPERIVRLSKLPVGSVGFGRGGINAACWLGSLAALRLSMPWKQCPVHRASAHFNTLAKVSQLH
jgi:hypothetical protein